MNMRPLAILALLLGAILPGIVISLQGLRNAQADLVSEIDNDGRSLATALKWGDFSFVQSELSEREKESRPGEFALVSVDGVAHYPTTISEADLGLVGGLAPGQLAQLDLSGGRLLVRRIDLERVAGLDPLTHGDTNIYVGRLLRNSKLADFRTLLLGGWAGYLLMLAILFGVYRWYRRRYVVALKQINSHLKRIGEARFDRIEVSSAAPEVRLLTGNINEMIQGLRSFLSGLVSLNSASVAHDVRTPLTLVRIGVGQIQKEMSGEEFEAQKRKVLERVDELASRFDSIFELAQERASAGNQSNFKRLDLGRMIESVVDDYAPLISDEGREIAFLNDRPDAPIVFGEENGFRRLLENLINNARKYSPVGAHISVELGGTHSDFRLSVSNTGGTFPEDIRSSAFDARSRSRFVEHVEGLGLGLNHVRTIAAKHGWSVEISDRPDIAEVVISGAAAIEGLDIAAA